MSEVTPRFRTLSPDSYGQRPMQIGCGRLRGVDQRRLSCTRARNHTEGLSSYIPIQAHASKSEALILGARKVQLLGKAGGRREHEGRRALIPIRQDKSIDTHPPHPAPEQLRVKGQGNSRVSRLAAPSYAQPEYCTRSRRETEDEDMATHTQETAAHVGTGGLLAPSSQSGANATPSTYITVSRLDLSTQRNEAICIFQSESQIRKTVRPASPSNSQNAQRSKKKIDRTPNTTQRSVIIGSTPRSEGKKLSRATAPKKIARKHQSQREQSKSQLQRQK
ncbi:hypothetical protein C8R45DRAFT_921660 [Mycena sanguinolenta]|nr:hypothetical protein C8R45DRAFT_921660 [Mycena sanguinolenta]